MNTTVREHDSTEGKLFAGIGLGYGYEVTVPSYYCSVYHND